MFYCLFPQVLNLIFFLLTFDMNSTFKLSLYLMTAEKVANDNLFLFLLLSFYVFIIYLFFFSYFILIDGGCTPSHPASSVEVVHRLIRLHHWRLYTVSAGFISGGCTPSHPASSVEVVHRLIRLHQWRLYTVSSGFISGGCTPSQPASSVI